jgi:hypothetical protein
VSPTSGTRSVITYSQAPDGKRIVKVSEATGLLSPLDLARCQVGTAGGRAVGSDSRVADFVLSETFCSDRDARALVLSATPHRPHEPLPPLVLTTEHISVAVRSAPDAL